MTRIIDIDTKMVGIFGQDCYRVGGSVRDEILGRPSKDADYVVRGRGMGEVIGLLAGAGGSVSPLRLRSGHVIGQRASFRGLGTVEVALPRKEVSTGPGRHDFDIVIDPEISISEDCLRRDFTFNALYKHLWDGAVADPTSRGLYDLQHKLISTTHSDSFRDDPLRMLRALRFVSCLGFDLSRNAIVQMCSHARAATGLNHNGNMSGTVWNELAKLLMGDGVAAALRDGFDFGPLAVLFPDMNPDDSFDRLETAAKLEASLNVRLALMFSEVGVASFLDSVRPLSDMPKQTKIDVKTILENPIIPKRREILWQARFMRMQFGDKLACEMLQAAACCAAHERHAHNKLGVIGSLEAARQRAVDQGIPSKISELKVGGRDCIEAGHEGAMIGHVLRGLLMGINSSPSPETLTRDWQLGWINGR